MNISPTLTERVKTLRTAKALSMRQLARLCSCSATHISDIEQGKKKPSPTLLELLAKALSTTTGYLLHGEDAERLAFSKLTQLVEQHGDKEDLDALYKLKQWAEERWVEHIIQSDRVKVNILKVYEYHAKKGSVPEPTKKALEMTQREIDGARSHLEALTRKHKTEQS